jgi:HlyD family secretion protein
MLKNKKTYWIILIMILMLAGGGYYFISATTPVEANEEPSVQTAMAREGELVVFASGAGQVVTASELKLGFDESGTLIDLNVEVGDELKVDDIIARLQTQNTQGEIDADISDAELNVIRAQQALDELYSSAEIARTNALNDIATFAQQVRDAQYQLENYTLPTYLQGLDVIGALDLMKARLDEASAAFEPYRYYSQYNDTRQELLEALNEAQSQYDAAVKRLNYEYELEVADANLGVARQEYEEYQDGPAADELALAEAELANVQAKLALAQDTQVIIDLVAPMNGTVIAVDAGVGEAIGTTPIITLADLEQPLLEVYLDETDLHKVAVGYETEVVFDALPDQLFTGQVISVNPSLETVSGVQAIKVLVIIDTETLNSDTALLVGLNASVDIIAGSTDNAVLIPVEALRELSPGEYAVFVVENEEPKLRTVEVGLMDITSAEILSGLEPGEVVTTGIVETK